MPAGDVDMNRTLRRIRGALGMGLLWAVAWAVVGGGIMEGIVDPHGEIEDIWPVVLAILGFLGGVAFSIVLGIVARRRRFEELSMPQFTGWGAAAGLLLGALAVVTGAGIPVIAVTTLGCALSAAGSLALARRAERHALLGARTDAQLPEGESKELLGRRD